MINNFDQMWEKMQAEFEKTNNKMDDEFGKVYSKIDDESSKLNTKIDEGFAKMDQRFTKIEDKLDIITNTNLAQILNVVTETRKELKEAKNKLGQTRIKDEVIETREKINDKLDKHIEKNEFEHKKFDYKLAEMELKYKYKN